MNSSEREVAEVLDSLRVVWEYEPTLFILKRAEDGTVLKGFRPDFFLPKYNFYIEVTKAKQAHTTEKHRKVRQAMALYPDVRIGLVQRADFENLEQRVKKLLREAKSQLEG